MSDDDAHFQIAQVKQRFAEVRAVAIDHPWSLIALGALAGFWVGGHGKHGTHGASFVGAALGGFAVRMLRDVALFEMGRIIRAWMAEATPPARYAH